MARNKWEQQLREELEPYGFEYESEQIEYTTVKKYTPDFVLERSEAWGDWKFFVECKGYFRPGDTQKYLAIRDAVEYFGELVFILYNHAKPVRKGAKLTMGQWCTKHGIDWFSSAEELREYVDADS